jgi:CO/xanthine dehydrogenase Mo-binding subunit
VACGFKNTGLGMGHPDIGRCVVKVLSGRVEIYSGAACIGQGIATVLTQIACEVLGLDVDRVHVALPDTAMTPDSGTTTASRQTLVTGEACRRACVAAVAAAAAALEAEREERAERESPRGDSGGFPYSSLAGREFSGEYDAATDPFEADAVNPIRHVAYSYACQLAILGPDDRLERIVAAHDSGLVVNPQAFEGQVEGGVAMGIGFALTEDFPLADCVPTARFGQLGLLHAKDMPSVETIIIRKAGQGSAADGGVSSAGHGAKGIGEISTIPTAAAVAGAYFARDGRLRTRLPLEGTPYHAAGGG